MDRSNTRRELIKTALVASITTFAGLIPATAFLTGCGGGSGHDNSLYQGSYRAQYVIPGTNETGFFSFTVDLKGNMVGSLTNGTTNQVRTFSGSVNSKGQFSGSTNLNGVSGNLSGTLSTGTSGGTTNGGDFTLNEVGKSFAGNFTINGQTFTVQNSGFRGYYAGTFILAGNASSDANQSGQVSFTVDTNGGIFGSFTNTQESGRLTGAVQSSGGFSAQVAFPSGATATLTGTLVNSTDGIPVGTFNYVQTASGKSVASNGTFAPASSSTGSNPYTASYRGTYRIFDTQSVSTDPNTATKEDGNVSFTVDPSGSLVGSMNPGQNLPVGTIAAKVNTNGSFSGTVTYAASVNQVTRTISGTFANSSVSGKSGDFLITVGAVTYPGNIEIAVASAEPVSLYQGGYNDGDLPAGPNASSFIFNGIDAPNRAQVSTNNVTLPFRSGFGSNFSIDKEGRIQGAFVSGGAGIVDQNTGIVSAGSFGQHYPLTGVVSNDGRIAGYVTGNDGNQYQFTGIVNLGTLTYLLYTITTVTPAPVPAGQTPGQNTYILGTKSTQSPSLTGNLNILINGQNYPVELTVLGGPVK